MLGVYLCVYNTFYQETTTITAVITFGGFQFLLSLLSAPSEPATRLFIVVVVVIVQRSTNYLSSPKLQRERSLLRHECEIEKKRERYSDRNCCLLSYGMEVIKQSVNWLRDSLPWCNHHAKVRLSVSWVWLSEIYITVYTQTHTTYTQSAAPVCRSR